MVRVRCEGKWCIVVKKAGKTTVHSGEKMIGCEGELCRVVKGWMREVKGDAMS